jgi:hypothetical protein
MNIHNGLFFYNLPGDRAYIFLERTILLTICGLKLSASR